MARDHSRTLAEVRLAPEDFAEEYRLGDPGVVGAEARRYADVLGGETDEGDRRARCLDGHAIYVALVGEDADRPAASVEWSRFDDPVTAFLADRSWDRSALEPVAEPFVEWYADLYAEPGADEDAWDPDRMEYEAAVSAGAGSDETVFEAGEYRGGRLDWYDFTTAPRSIREAGSATSDPETLSTQPTKAAFRGMPASRLWELEDADVDLASMSAAADDLSRLFLLEFALIAGDDWFTLPIEAPAGSMTRVTDLSVTDTFGERTEEVPATADRADEWQLFAVELPNHVEPGLFLPPTLGTTLSGETVEDVLFGRDEMANLAFGVETVVEGALGDPLDREQFRFPTAEIAALHTASEDLSGRDAADEEYADLRNPGDAPLGLDGWTLYAQHSDLTEPPSASNAEALDLDGITLPPEGTVRVVTGGDADLDTDERVHLQRTAPVLASDRVVSVTTTTDDGTERLVTAEPVERDVLEEYPGYRLANEVPDHWFPYLPTTEGETHRFKLGLLLDRDALSGTLDDVPRPRGRVLDPEALVYDEELPRGGLRVTRSYESTAWLDGSTYVWSSREVRPGVGEVSSGLRFDFLEHERDSE